MTMEDYDRDHDTDSISVTSTVPSEHSETAVYDVEDILAEGDDFDVEGNKITKYLIKWDGYPMHRCSWEPTENLAGTDLLQIWQDRSTTYDAIGFIEYIEKNNRDFENSKQKAEAAKARRQQKRAKKRKKLPLPSPRDKGGNDSDSDSPLITSRRKAGRAQQNISEVPQHKETEDRASLFVRETRTPRKPPLIQSSSSDESGGSEDTLLEELKVKGEKRKAPEKPSRASERRPSIQAQSATSKSTQKRKPQGSPSSSTSLQKRPTEPKEQRQEPPSKPPAGTSTVPIAQDQGVKPAPKMGATTSTTVAPRRGSVTKATASATAAGTTQTRNASAATRATATSGPIASMRRSGPIKMVNEPKTLLRKPWQKGGADELYSKMHFRRKAELRARNEQTPDPSALLFVNTTPGGISRKPTQVNDNLYGRRETGLRRIQNDDSDFPPEIPQTNPSIEPPEWEAEKVPLTCFEWRNGSCQYKAEQCRFLHRHTDKVAPVDGRVPPKYNRPPLTCHFWLRNKGGCQKADDECNYAHWNTGWLGIVKRPPEQIDPSEQPVSEGFTCFFWLTSPKGCVKRACKYAHRNTGWLPPGTNQPARPIDPKAIPVSQRRSSEPTCYFWSRGFCRYSDEECKNSHWDTGRMADRPEWVRNRNALKAAAPHSELDYIPPQPEPSFGPPSGSDAVYTTDPLPGGTAELNKTVTPSTQEPPNLATASSTQQAPARLSCMELKKRIESACKLDLANMFTYTAGAKGDMLLDRRAFLIFHPGDHMEEIELVTRWLLMHHVEVFTFWFDGAWDSFKQKIIDGGTGVIIAHPDFEYFSEIPNFGDILQRDVRVWSVGHQYGVEYDPQISTFPPVYRYDCIEIFPLGGFIYITDDVFENEPAKAFRIIELFIAKVEQCRQVAGPIDPWKYIDDGCLLWRIAARPDLMESIFKQCVAHEAEIDAQDPVQLCRVKLYELLHRTRYVEQDHPGEYNIRPEDYFPIMSERPEHATAYFEALERSQKEANNFMVHLYGGLAIDHRRHYRQYFVVHTDPSETGWKESCQTIDEVMTPEQCIKYFEQPAKGNRFEFYEWAFPKKTNIAPMDSS